LGLPERWIGERVVSQVSEKRGRRLARIGNQFRRPAWPSSAEGKRTASGTAFSAVNRRHGGFQGGVEALAHHKGVSQ